MIGFVTAGALERSFSVPLSLPQSTVASSTAVQVAVVTLGAGDSAVVGWLTCHLVSIAASPTDAPGKLNTGLGAVYAGIYPVDGAQVTAAAGQPLGYTPVDIPNTAFTCPPAFPTELSGPGTFAVLAVNNLSVAADIVVTGAVRVTRGSAEG